MEYNTTWCSPKCIFSYVFFIIILSPTICSSYISTSVVAVFCHVAASTCSSTCAEPTSLLNERVYLCSVWYRKVLGLEGDVKHLCQWIAL